MAEHSWEQAADEHHYLNNLLVNIATRTGEEGPAGKAISQAADALDKSVEHHANGEYRSAHKQIQVAGEHISRAASLGDYHDKFYGSSMHPKDAAESEAISYKHGYLS